jgi:hypothetical protein
VRIEILPIILGALVALLGIGIIVDAWSSEASFSSERRRRPRVERHRNGEALIGLGVLALAAAFIGRDSWRYSVLVVIIGAVFLLVGAILNARYVRELFVNRGPLRRREMSASMESARVSDVATRMNASAESAPAADVRTRMNASAESTAVSDVETPREASPIIADRVVAEPVNRDWDGAERRSVPREGPKRKPRRGRPEDPARDR